MLPEVCVTDFDKIKLNKQNYRPSFWKVEALLENIWVNYIFAMGNEREKSHIAYNSIYKKRMRKALIKSAKVTFN